ncbi:hypothetical protein [Methylobacterium sp. UNC378MF]|uniref:hypothetical protein n=1 Tax=Methylobacterium sp. UNC378MF TaxID=1502748 RepID=UPI001FCD563F|nr:hypothetical protein [Methylobacterium sp. UNC378MF]
MAGNEARPIGRPQETVGAQAFRTVEDGSAPVEIARTEGEVHDPDLSRAHATPRGD